MRDLNTTARRKALMDILRLLQEEEKKKLEKKKGVPKVAVAAAPAPAPTPEPVNNILTRMLKKKAELKK